VSAAEQEAREERIARALATTPDIPRWVEARAILLSGSCAVFGEEGSWAIRNEGPGGRLVAVVGRPDPAAIAAALSDRPDRELLCSHEQEGALAALFPDWVCERGLLFQLAHPEQLPAPDPRVRLLEDADSLEHLSEELRASIEPMRREYELHAAFVGGLAVSLAYTHWKTEALCDISIDTAPPHRRKGLARATVSSLIRADRARGLHPVWGAMASNLASQKLAATLGFELVDQIASLQRP